MTRDKNLFLKLAATKCLLLQLSLCFCATLGFSQGYFPLKSGNIWQYWASPGSFYVRSLRALGDTTLNNGLTYSKLMQDNPAGIQYFRQAGSRIITYSTYENAELVWGDYSKTTGDTVARNYYQGGDTTVVLVLYDQIGRVFGRTLRIWGFYERSVISSTFVLREITDSIGITFETYEAAPYDDSLAGALIDGKQYGIITSVSHTQSLNPTSYQLLQNYPNPFNSETHIKFSAPESEKISLEVFDVLGQRIELIFDGLVEPGIYEFTFTPHGLSSGVFFYELRAASTVLTKRMLYLR